MEINPGIPHASSDDIMVHAPSAASVARAHRLRHDGRPSDRTSDRLSDPDQTQISWGNVVWLTVLHAGALAAPFYFSWQALALTVLLHWWTGSIGICMGFHRYLTHASFQTYKPVRWLLAWIGGLAGEGSAIDWVANHRKHHAHSDQEGDPHSPLDGKWWSHVFWLAWRYPADRQLQHTRRWAPDLADEPALLFLQRTFLLWHFVMGGVLFAAGYALGGTYLGLSFLIWGIFVRLVFVLHATWFVNSASHIWGYRNYATTDQSRNNWWVAIISYGEGWHNNHHAFPRMAAHGHRWYEIDVTYWAIRLMRAVGLAWDVVDYKRGSEKRSKSPRVPQTAPRPAEARTS
jgi:stearoyl-CoA desaturase (delta-9 desaturase)